MNDLLDVVLFVLALFAGMSALLYVLATIDPQTERTQPAAVDAGP